MPVDFFTKNCQEPPRADREFGLVDDQTGNKAFSTADSPETWIATVKNERLLPVAFSAIDQCVEIRKPNGDLESRCDGMLTYEAGIVFVELKIQRRGWQTDAINQLASTIRHFAENHDLSQFRKKRAFACNKKHPSFNIIENEAMKRFYDEFKVRLNVQAEIVI